MLWVTRDILHPIENIAVVHVAFLDTSATETHEFACNETSLDALPELSKHDGQRRGTSLVRSGKMRKIGAGLLVSGLQL